jgi:DNA repair photolyase
MFKVIKRFNDAGIRCAVNMDPIIPLITDSTNDIRSRAIRNNLHFIVRYWIGF